MFSFIRFLINLFIKNWFRMECLSKYDTFSLENLPNYVNSFKTGKNVYCK